jgi:hypothetical protein
MFREPSQFLQQDAAQLAQAQVEDRIGNRLPVGFSFAGPAAGGAGLCFNSDVVGDPIQPATDRLVLLNRTGLLCQDQEGGLEGVLGVMQVTQHASTHSQHHRAVTPQESRKGIPIAVAGEALQQLAVGVLFVGVAAGQASEVLQDGTELCGTHDPFFQADPMWTFCL